MLNTWYDQINKIASSSAMHFYYSLKKNDSIFYDEKSKIDNLGKSDSKISFINLTRMSKFLYLFKIF